MGFKKGMIPWNKGKKMSLSFREAVGKSHKGIKLSETAKQNIKMAKLGDKNPMFGKKLSSNHKKKISESGKKSGVGKWMNGRRWAKEALKKRTVSQSGENHYNWKGGISFDPYPIEWTQALKESIRERDNHICQECGTCEDELERKLDVHHIDYNKDNLNPKNLIALCRLCHIKTNTNRDYWANYFNNGKNS